MKKQFFFSMLATATLLASCASDDAVDNSPLSKGEGYVRLAINLPSITGTTSRAVNDVFDDGTANEYAVSDATLILFEGEHDYDAKLSTAYNLNLSFNQEGTNDNITSTAQIVQKINDPLASGNNFYALVVLNKNNQLAVDVNDNSLKVNGTLVTGMTLQDFITSTKIATGATQLYDNTNVKDFFMSNAPLNTVAGAGTDPSTGTVQTLPVLDPTKVYATEDLAASNPATEVSVERAVAKVTLTATTGQTTSSTPKRDYTIEGWQLDNTNTESYLVRNVDGFTSNWAALFSNGVSTNKYRFVGSNEVSTGLYRTYWGLDPNYDTADGTGMNYWDEQTTPAITYVAADGTKHPLYCAENTFDVAHQHDINTTHAIVKTVFNGGTTFYTINHSSSTFYEEGDGTSGIETAIKSSFMTNTDIVPVLTPLLKTGRDLTAADLTVTFNTDKAGRILVKDITIKGEALASGTDLKASALTITGTTTARDLINNANTIRRYVDGVSYYSVPIKHFGDDLTPWNNGETPTPSAGAEYPTTNSAANYLGRYGVLRNNWYDIEVTAIKNLGSPTVPPLGRTVVTPDPDDPDPDPTDPDVPGDGGNDDDIDQYIAVKIKVLSWAKRTQSVTL